MKSLTIAQPRAILEDPHACTDSSDALSIFSALFDALVRRGPAGYEPAIATDWTMSDDARTTIFTLREGVRFHDGEACDAEAVRHCLLRMARPDMGATLGAPGVYSQYLADMEIEILDARRLKIVTATPLADLLDILHVGHIVSPRALEAAGDDLAARAVGTGPYRLLQAETGGRVVVAGHEDLHGRKAAFDQIGWLGESLPDARLQKLVEGSAQIANGLEHAAGLDNLTAQNRTMDFLAPTAIIMMFNCTTGPGADPRVRLALNLAIDRDALVRDVLAGAGQPLHGYVSPAHDGFDPDAGALPKDRAKARRLLEEAGYGSGLTLDTYCPTRLPDEAEKLVAALGAQLADLGVAFRVHLDPDRVRYANQVRLKNIHDICVFDSSPMSCFRVLYEKIDSRVRGSWWEGYSNPEAERLLDIARRTVDRGRRLAVFREIYRLLQADPPWLYLYNHRRTLGLTKDIAFTAPRPDGVLDVRRLSPS